MNATERFRVLQNIVAQKGIESDLWAELGRAEQIINMMDQGKMMPPLMPEETAPDELSSPTQGKYDDL